MRRIANWIFGLLGLSACLFVVGFILFANAATRPNTPEDTRADGIVVLTGGGDRIKAGLKLLDADRSSRLLITGVNRATRRSELKKLIAKDSVRFDCCVDLGYEAQNTSGNAREIARWVRSNGFGSLIVVTSNYHMPRSLVELSRELPETRFTAYAVVPNAFRGRVWWLNMDYIRVLGIEYLKYLSSVARLIAEGAMGSGNPATAAAGSGSASVESALQ